MRTTTTAAKNKIATNVAAAPRHPPTRGVRHAGNARTDFYLFCGRCDESYQCDLSGLWQQPSDDSVYQCQQRATDSNFGRHADLFRNQSWQHTYNRLRVVDRKPVCICYPGTKCLSVGSHYRGGRSPSSIFSSRLAGQVQSVCGLLKPRRTKFRAE